MSWNFEAKIRPQRTKEYRQNGKISTYVVKCNWFIVWHRIEVAPWPEACFLGIIIKIVILFLMKTGFVLGCINFQFKSEDS